MVDLLLTTISNRNLGSIENGNLELYEDNIGLRAIATVTDEQVIKKRTRIKITCWFIGFWFLEKRFMEEVNLVFKKRSIETRALEVSILDMTPA